MTHALPICKIQSKIRQNYNLQNKTINTEFIFTLRYIHTQAAL